MKRFLILPVLLACLSLRAQEYIKSFDVDAVINPGGGARITETITVNAELDQIKRGLVRDIPTKFNSAPFMRTDISPAVLGLGRDGQKEPYFTETPAGSLLRVNFGNNNFLTRGEHTYALVYEVKNVVLFHKDYDEFYWNVTGNYWNFPIRSSSAKVTLPDGAEIKTDLVSMYAGKLGDKNCAGCSKQINGNIITFKNEGTLYPGQGFTISVPFSKGVITEPAAAARLTDALRQNLWLPLGVLLLVFGSIYLYVVWLKLGRDPVGASVIPAAYEPPAGFSPAQLQYINDMGFTTKDKLIQTILVSLAVKGLVSIEKKDSMMGFLNKKFIIRKNFESEAVASPEETMFMNGLFSDVNFVETDPEYRENFLDAAKKAKEVLKMNYAKQFFARNLLWFIPFWALCAVCFFLMFYQDGPAVAAVISAALTAIFVSVNRFRGFDFFASFITVVRILALIFILFLNFNMVFMPRVSVAHIVLIVLLFAVNELFLYLDKAYTVKGRAVMDGAEGFKKYLAVGEKGRIDESNPEKAMNIFCDFLPFAIGFGLANKWIKQFGEAFKAEENMRFLGARGLGSFASGSGNFSYGSFTSAMHSFNASISNGMGGGGAGGMGGAGGGAGGGGGGGR